MKETPRGPYAVVLLLMLLLALPCGPAFVEGVGESKAALAQADRAAQPEPREVNYLDECEGLHITGTPIEIDIITYRLMVTGKVNRPLALSFDEVKALVAVDRKLALECPGFFMDIGTWTGVLVRTLLEEAGARTEREAPEGAGRGGGDYRGRHRSLELRGEARVGPADQTGVRG